MRLVIPRRLEVYQTQNGQEPFNQWLESIQDKQSENRINRYLDRIAAGNLGNARSVGAGVYELRLHFGSGYRIYFGEVGNTVVLLLCGGDKSSQRSDIRRAKTYWSDYKEKS